MLKWYVQPGGNFHNVATVGLDSLRSICPNIALETPVASASRERLQPRCWRSCLSVVDKSERDFPCDSSGKTEVYHLCVITDKCYGACTL